MTDTEEQSRGLGCRGPRNLIKENIKYQDQALVYSEGGGRGIISSRQTNLGYRVKHCAVKGEKI